MADKVTKIQVVRACIVNGAHAIEGQLFDVPKDVSENDARYLLGVGKARAYASDEKAAEKKPAAK